LLALAFIVVVRGVCVAQPQQDLDNGRFLRWSYQDPVDWFGSWDTKRLLHVAAVGAVLVPISLLDEPVDEALGEQDSGQIADVADYLGTPLAILTASGAFGLTLITTNSKLQDAAFTSVQSALYANVIAFTIKLSVGRARPDANLGAHHFEPFSDPDASFPSGHTTTAFALLSAWTFYYPSIWTYGLLGAAAATGLSRMVKRRHWFTDVLGGAALGSSTSHWLARKHQGLRTSLTVIPVITSGRVFVSASLTL